MREREEERPHYETNVPRSVKERRQEVAGTQENMKNEEIQPGTRRRCFFAKRIQKPNIFAKNVKNLFVSLTWKLGVLSAQKLP